MVTKKQQQVLEFVEKYQKKHKYSPTLEEIQAKFDLASVSTAHYYIKQLKDQGQLSKKESKQRGILVAKNEPRIKKEKKQVELKLTQNKTTKIYEGDALEILPEIAHEKVDMIYLDPPFDTGRDFKYEAMSESVEFTDKWADDSYELWLDNLISKLKNTLKKDGNLFFHISAELSGTPQKVLQKYFKKVEPIFWKKAHGKNTVKNKLGSVIDIIYRACDENSYFKIVYEPLDEYYFENSYRNKDSVGLYALGSLVHDKTRSGHKYTVEHNGVVYGNQYGWKKKKEEILRLMKEDRIHFGKATNGKPPRLYKKLYKHECKGKPLSNLWTDIAYITRNEQDRRLYPTQKPVELLKRLIEIGCREDGTVLDPVAGSGTTGAAAKYLNRKSVLIDKNKEAIKIMKSRLEVN